LYQRYFEESCKEVSKEARQAPSITPAVSSRHEVHPVQETKIDDGDDDDSGDGGDASTMLRRPRTTKQASVPSQALLRSKIDHTGGEKSTLM